MTRGTIPCNQCTEPSVLTIIWHAAVTVYIQILFLRLSWLDVFEVKNDICSLFKHSVVSTHPAHSDDLLAKSEANAIANTPQSDDPILLLVL